MGNTLVAELVPCNLFLWNHRVTLEAVHPHRETLNNCLFKKKLTVAVVGRVFAFLKNSITFKDAFYCLSASTYIWPLKRNFPLGSKAFWMRYLFVLGIKGLFWPLWTQALSFLISRDHSSLFKWLLLLFCREFIALKSLSAWRLLANAVVVCSTIWLQFHKNHEKCKYSHCCLKSLA